MTLGACALLAWAAPTAVAQETSPPRATVSIGPQAVAAELYGGDCTFVFNDDGTAGGSCPSITWPPTRFADLTATGESAIIRFDRPIALNPYTALWSRDPTMRTLPGELTPVQRDELTFEIVLPRVNEPSFLRFGGRWSTPRAKGNAGYVVGVLPPPVDSVLEIRKAKWTGARLRVSGKVHPFASAITLRFACNATATTRIVPAGAGQWSTVLPTPAACATTSGGRLVARVSSTERLRPAKVALRLTHRIARREDARAASLRRGRV